MPLRGVLPTAIRSALMPRDAQSGAAGARLNPLQPREGYQVVPASHRLVPEQDTRPRLKSDPALSPVMTDDLDRPFCPVLGHGRPLVPRPSTSAERFSFVMKATPRGRRRSRGAVPPRPLALSASSQVARIVLSSCGCRAHARWTASSSRSACCAPRSPAWPASSSSIATVRSRPSTSSSVATALTCVESSIRRREQPERARRGPRGRGAGSRRGRRRDPRAPRRLGAGFVEDQLDHTDVSK
jgi:hypothetical protein